MGIGHRATLLGALAWGPLLAAWVAIAPAVQGLAGAGEASPAAALASGAVAVPVVMLPAAGSEPVWGEDPGEEDTPDPAGTRAGELRCTPGGTSPDLPRLHRDVFLPAPLRVAPKLGPPSSRRS